jgi:hypothetical protein
VTKVSGAYQRSKNPEMMPIIVAVAAMIFKVSRRVYALYDAPSQLAG